MSTAQRITSIRGILAGSSAALVMCLSPAPANASPADWPMWGYDASRAGATPVQLAEALHLHWVRELPEPRRAWPAQRDDLDKLEFDVSYTPVVLGERLFVGSMTNDSLTAYHLDTGEQLWRTYFDGPVRLAPAAWQDRVFAASDDGHLYCVDAATGRELWRYSPAPSEHRALGNQRVIHMWPARGGPVVFEDTVYFAAGVWPFQGTFIVALDARTGALVWENRGDGSDWQRQPHGGAFSFAGISPQGYLAATEDRLVVAGGRSTPALLDRATGDLIFTDVFGQGVGGYRVATDGTHFYNHGCQYRLSDGVRIGGRAHISNETLQRRARDLRRELDGDVFTELAAHGRLIVVTTKGTIYCFGPDTRQALTHRHAPDLPATRQDDAGQLAEALLQESGEHAGYALFMGVGNGDLLEQLALRSDLHLVGIDPDVQKIARLRRRFDAAGLYGTRISLLPGDPVTAAYPPYISSFIVVDPSVFAGDRDPQRIPVIFQRLRPYGGKAFIAITPEVSDTVRQDLEGSSLPGGRIGRGAGMLTVTREGPLPGAGQWTHQHANAANTVNSQDDVARTPLGILWYGGPTNEHVIPRHALGPRPQVAGGRVVVLGVETVSARDAYTGRELWVREFPGIGHAFTVMELEERWQRGDRVYMTNQPGASYIGSPYVSMPDSIYVRYQRQIHRLNPATGETIAVFRLPGEALPGEEVDWGHISVMDDLLITTSETHIFDDEKLGERNLNASSSQRIHVLDRFTGEERWSREAKIGFRHNAIVSASGRMFVIDGLSEDALKLFDRRGISPDAPSRVIAMEAKTGRVAWEADSHVFGTFLSYSAEHDILVEGGVRDGRSHLTDEPTDQMAARRGVDGELLWSRGGRYDGPVIIHGERVISARPGSTARSLRTGADLQYDHPLTGEKLGWDHGRTYGCGSANASNHLLLFRTGSAGYLDMQHNDGGTATLGGFKSGCTANMVAADGIVNAPDYTRTCTCSYQNQTSLGLIHMPDLDYWTFDRRLSRGRGPIRRLGINLGAPGNRPADDGTLWTAYPRGLMPSADIPVRIDTVQVKDTPVHIRSVQASQARETLPDSTLDGDSATQWSSRSNDEKLFREWIEFRLSAPIEIDRVGLLWVIPENTRFEIRTRLGQEEWQIMHEARGQSDGTDPETYRFDPVMADTVRIEIHDHQAEEKNSWSHIRQVRIGTLPFPDAYGYFLAKDFFRQPSLAVDAAQGLPWVAAWGIRGIRSMLVENLDGGNAPYTVTLHFSEPDAIGPGERRFDIHIQGQPVVRGFDVASTAGGTHRAITRTFPGVRLDDALALRFVPAEGTRYPPILSGVEIVREETQTAGR